MKRILQISLQITAAVFAVMLVSGCSKFFTIGKNKGYCEEHGCDYSDAGLCADPYDVYQKRNQLGNEPYSNIKCKCRQQSDTATVYREKK